MLAAATTTPLFAGIIALTDQVAGRRLGLINPGLAFSRRLTSFCPRVFDQPI
jgi:subtilase family serine protease